VFESRISVGTREFLSELVVDQNVVVNHEKEGVNGSEIAIPIN
jgi:hypothetical protein